MVMYCKWVEVVKNVFFFCFLFSFLEVDYGTKTWLVIINTFSRELFAWMKWEWSCLYFKIHCVERAKTPFQHRYQHFVGSMLYPLPPQLKFNLQGNLNCTSQITRAVYPELTWCKVSFLSPHYWIYVLMFWPGPWCFGWALSGLGAHRLLSWHTPWQNKWNEHSRTCV